MVFKLEAQDVPCPWSGVIFGSSSYFLSSFFNKHDSGTIHWSLKSFRIYIYYIFWWYHLRIIVLILKSLSLTLSQNGWCLPSSAIWTHPSPQPSFNSNQDKGHLWRNWVPDLWLRWQPIPSLKTNISTNNRPSQMENSLPTTIFGGRAVSFSILNLYTIFQISPCNNGFCFLK